MSKVIDGREIAKVIKEEIKEFIESRLSDTFPQAKVEYFV